MATVLDGKQIKDEVDRATKLARKVKRPKGVHGVTVAADQDADGNPMFIVSVAVDDDLNPSDERLDELVDFEDELSRVIRGGDFVSWPLVRFEPRGDSA
jgi:hypothetical protein